MSVNKVTLIGRAGKDPEIKTTKDGKKVAVFTLATNDYAKNKEDQKTQWHNVTLWEGLAEVAEKYLKKGQEVYIEGRLSYEEYTDKEGVKRNYTRIIGSSLQLLGGKKDGDSAPAAEAPAKTAAAKPAAKTTAPSEPAPAMADTEDTDLPF